MVFSATTKPNKNVSSIGGGQKFKLFFFKSSNNQNIKMEKKLKILSNVHLFKLFPL
jgi:hypothetical protein